jgi:uncharacterized membrane protein YhhN
MSNSEKLTLARLAWFLPYLIVGALHLVALFIGSVELDGATKPLLMPALLIAFLVALPKRRTEIAVLGTLALVFSWLGDVLLSTPGGIGFLIGLGAFLLAHATYLILFLRPLKVRRVPWLALIYLLWWVGLVAALARDTGTLLIPVAIYGLVLGGLAAAGLGSNRWIAVGAFLVLASDSVLAFKLFQPNFSLWEHDFVIMIMYIVGEGLITIGALLAAFRRVDNGAKLPSDTRA